MCRFESILKRGLCLGNLCNDSCLNVYKGVCVLKNVSMFESLFGKCFEIVYGHCFEMCDSLKIARIVCKRSSN